MVKGEVIADLYLGRTRSRVTGTLSQGTLQAHNLTEWCDGVPMTTIASLYDAIRDGQVYFNVHSMKFPEGVVRGQIFMNRVQLESCGSYPLPSRSSLLQS